MHSDFWHVLHVVANHEKRVAQHLSVRSIEHYLPLYTERSRWTDRSVRLERPLFLGYVFIHFSPQERLSVLSTPGALRLLGDGDGQRVSAVELDRIRESLAKGYSLRPYPSIPVGTQVRIRSGVFQGVEGVVTEFRQQCKVVIALTAVQQCFSLEIGTDDIEIAEEVSAGSLRIPRRMRLAAS